MSGTGNTVVAGTSPNYFSSANTINGKPIVRFLYGPANTLLKTSPVGVSSSDSGSTFIVLRLTNALSHNVFVIGTLGSGGREISISNIGTIGMNKSGLSVVASYAAGLTIGTVHQISILQNGGSNIILRIDGIQVMSVVPGATGYAAGNLSFAPGGAELDIAETLFYDNRVSDLDVSRIECYLGARYGTTTCP